MAQPTETTFDFLVIGGGTSGAVLAGSLANSATRPKVLLIEAGGCNDRDDLYVASERYSNVFKNPEIRTDYRTTPQKHVDGRCLDYIRGRGLGGSSIANYATYTRGVSADYDLWSDIVVDEAFKWDNVVERFKELENLHFDGDGDEFVKPRDGAHGFGGRLDITLLSRRQWPGSMDRLLRAACDFGWPLNPDQNSGDGVGIGMSSTTTYNGRRTTSAAWLKNPPSTLTIYTDTRAIKILMENSNPEQKPKAVGVLLADGRQVRASREVILSLGAVDTPRLLLLSGIGPQADLKELGLDCIVNQPQIGKNLMDHNWALLEWGVNTRFGDPVRHDLDPKQVSAAREEWLQHHTGPDATRTQAALVGFLKLDPQRHNLDELEKLDSQTSAWLKRPDVPHFELFLEGIFLHHWDDLYGKEPLSMGVMLMNPQSRGSITLASKDPSADPVIDVNFLSHPYDRQTLINGVREALAFMRSPSMAPYVTKELLVPESDSDADILAFCRKDLKSVFHPMGTVRMGPRNDASACVDPDFRLVGVDGLRVVDLSVCPVIPNHTQATAFLVGQMGWKRLEAEYNL